MLGMDKGNKVMALTTIIAASLAVGACLVSYFAFKITPHPNVYWDKPNLPYPDLELFLNTVIFSGLAFVVIMTVALKIYDRHNVDRYCVKWHAEKEAYERHCEEMRQKTREKELKRQEEKASKKRSRGNGNCSQRMPDPTRYKATSPDDGMFGFDPYDDWDMEYDIDRYISDPTYGEY